MKHRNYSYNSRIKTAKHFKRDSIYTNSTLETLRTDVNNRNSIADSLKFFVDNSESVKFIVEPKDKFKQYQFTRQSLYNSIYHHDKFNPEKEKKKINKNSQKYFDYDILLDKNRDNQRTFHKFETLISDLKMNCKDKTINSIQECEKIKVELEKNCDFLDCRLKQTREELNFHITEINEIKNDTDKIKRLNERIKCESTYINTEIPLIKEIIMKARNEIDQSNKEVTVIRSNCFNEEKQINFFQDEIEILKEKIKMIDKEKLKFRHDIINYKRKNDLIKENLKNENIKTNTLMNEIEYLIDKNKRK